MALHHSRLRYVGRAAIFTLMRPRRSGPISALSNLKEEGFPMTRWQVLGLSVAVLAVAGLAIPYVHSQSSTSPNQTTCACPAKEAAELVCTVYPLGSWG